MIELTFKQMILQATPGHEFVHKKPMFIFVTIANQFHQVGMSQLPKKDHLRLQKSSSTMLLKLLNDDDNDDGEIIQRRV